MKSIVSYLSPTKHNLAKFFMSFGILLSLVFVLTACSSAPAPVATTELTTPVAAKAIAPESNKEALPLSYTDIAYPEFHYVAPHPKEYRVELGDSITGFIVVDRTLPLISFSAFFKESTLPSKLSETAAFELLSPMYRRGGSKDIAAGVLDDSLEFVSASIQGGVGSYYSKISIDCLSKNFEEMLTLSKSVFTKPAFDEKELQIQKASYVTAYEHRFDNPASILAALSSKVNYASSPRLWNPTAEEYQKVSKKELQTFGASKFSADRIVFALAGDIDKDSAITLLKKHFADWKKTNQKKTTPSLSFLNKPGVYATEKELTQANISMSQPFVKRPHPDYYPAAVASFILGGGSFSSRLTAKVRSEEGLAYSVYSRTGSDYNDTALSTIALQTKAESSAFAIKLIFEEVKKLAEQGPTEEELDLAKKTLIESLPGMFDSPSSTASIFAADELVGKSQNHYIDYVQKINAITPEQIKVMIAKYFNPEKMTISIVGPAIAWKELKNVTVIPLAELNFRK